LVFVIRLDGNIALRVFPFDTPKKELTGTCLVAANVGASALRRYLILPR